MVFGPIAVTYNLPGVDKLVLDGPTAAKIFNGGITHVERPGHRRAEPRRPLPATKINVVYRNDQSGTTDNFQKYLDAASDGAWGKGAGKTFNGGVGEGAKGNEGTSAAIKSTPGAITYNEWSFAKAQNLAHGRRSSPRPGRTRSQISTEIGGQDHRGRQGQGQRATTWCWTPRRSTSRPQTGAYPIVLATYEIVCSKYADADTGTAVKAFLQSTISGGQAGLADNGYIPIPDTFKTKLTTSDQRHLLTARAVPPSRTPAPGVLTDAGGRGPGADRKAARHGRGRHVGWLSPGAGPRRRRRRRHRLPSGSPPARAWSIVVSIVLIAVFLLVQAIPSLRAQTTSTS